MGFGEGARLIRTGVFVDYMHIQQVQGKQREGIYGLDGVWYAGGTTFPECFP